jgi:phage shock protein C
MAVTKSLKRSRTNRMIGGVVGGLAEYIGMDPALARLLYVAISVFSAAFPGILVYIVLLIVVPEA